MERGFEALIVVLNTHKTRMESMVTREKGFTLIEILISTLILAVGLLTLARMQVAAMNGNLTGNQMTVATTLAQDQIEELRVLGYTDATLTDAIAGNNGTLMKPANPASFDHADANNPINEQGGATGLRRYRRFWNIADDTPTTGVKTVVVFVYWGGIQANGLPRHRIAIPTVIGP